VIKDYYTILELPPSATMGEIKKAYRRLALQYHPDKNQGDRYAAAQFVELKEAYEVLTNPAKKEYYLQQRWYQQSQGKRKTQSAITPVAILKQALELEKYVARLDQFRMDKQGLHDYILDILNYENIEKLNGFNELSTNDAIITAFLDAMRPLPYALTKSLIKAISKLHCSEMVQGKISLFVQEKRNSGRRDRYKIWLMLVLVLLFCLFVLLS
jgi:molecular chaperone DnaJ